ncbi:MAG TPA: glucose-6-phosphate dehydrogenase [Nevskiaceae bacterium]|nr:glucose-6-phosphate dehydrogenase [Nevskiaceae bacterium]
MINSPRIPQPTILVIVGISGDLAKRKLLPAISQIAAAGVLPKHFRILGITRQQLTLDDVLPAGDQQFLRQALELHQMDLTQTDDYVALTQTLQKIETAFKKPAQRLFYLSIPPDAATALIGHLGAAGLNTPATKLLLEKPFGTDLASAESLIATIQKHFNEKQIYRIDHFLAKEMAQNMVVFRGSNSLFKRTWNKEFIESIDIVASEQLGVEGRKAFYEQAGALRDFVQSHLLQLAALTLMDLPASSNWQAVPKQRLRALQQLSAPADIRGQVVRGQYQGYRKEVGNTHSTVETFVSLTLQSRDPRWAGVPITITTGKALDRKATEIRINYKQEEHFEANVLILRIQPNEGVDICLWIKKPGFEHEVQQLSLDFSYSNHYTALPEAYERVFVDAMRGDRSLFATSDEVLASWRILEPIQHAWSMGKGSLNMYKQGSTAEAIMHPPGSEINRGRRLPNLIQ